MSDRSDVTLRYRAAGWVFHILMGPLLFGTELTGPTGGTDWKQWVCAFVGTGIWLIAIMVVVRNV